MNLTAIKDNIIVERLEKDLTRESGIILQRSDEADKAKIISVGPDIVDVNLDEVVLINWNKARKISKDVYQVNIEDVIGVFED
jgi:co-chaperonin GroES (HSP10)